MARPEGYRKAQRLMTLADRFDLPLLTFVDTPGAYPGIGAEQRGQAEAIARCIDVCLSIRVPIISVVIGEGGSGGAIALATANHAVMLEHSIYSVLTRRMRINFGTADKAQAAAEALRLTAQDLQNLDLIDEAAQNPSAARIDPSATIHTLGERMRATLDVCSLDGDELASAAASSSRGQIGPELSSAFAARASMKASITACGSPLHFLHRAPNLHQTRRASHPRLCPGDRRFRGKFSTIRHAVKISSSFSTK